jgi:hypothetical protein
MADTIESRSGKPTQQSCREDRSGDPDLAEILLPKVTLLDRVPHHICDLSMIVSEYFRL